MFHRQVKICVTLDRASCIFAFYSQRPHHPVVAENNLNLQCKAVISPGRSDSVRFANCVLFCFLLFNLSDNENLFTLAWKFMSNVRITLTREAYSKIIPR